MGILSIRKGKKLFIKIILKGRKWCWVCEEDEVLFFIYEFVRCGRIVYVWLLESLSVVGFFGVEFGCLVFFGRVFFFNRVEFSLSFLLFGNVFVLYDFDD